MKKINFLFITAALIFALSGCGKKDNDHDKDDHTVSGTSPTNVHAPISGSDSIKFTADTTAMMATMFSPMGGNNHVVVHDMTTGSDLYNGMISANDNIVTGFIPGHSYAIIGYSGATQTNFANAVSSFRNTGQMPVPFTGYTQYYNNSSSGGPTDGVVILLEDEPGMGSKRK